MKTLEEAPSRRTERGRHQRDITFRAVKQWAVTQGIGSPRFNRACEKALLVAMSRLLQGIFREGHARHAKLWQRDADRWFLDLGRDPMLRAPVSGPLPFRRLELTGLPWTLVASRRRVLRNSRTFLNALRVCLKPSRLSRYFDRLIADFDNSFANLVMNRLIAQRLDARAEAIEPAYEGHHYYPFPALRLGTPLQQVVECSNLNQKPIDLTLVAASPALFDSATYADYRECFHAWAGIPLPRNADVVIPLHPWQLALSPVIRELLKRKWIAVLDQRIAAIPLASQRTCRILKTGFDVKLPAAVTLTGEDRLIYPLNRANAVPFSSLARILLRDSSESSLDFQYDVATIAHADPLIGTHLAAIIRAPVKPRTGEVVAPALNLWCGPRQARTLLDLHNRDEAYKFFRAYCRVLMRGVIDFYARYGMAFEPHLQNVYVAIRDGMPSRMILRDLDSTILDPDRIRPIARQNGIRLARGTWQHMPTTGGRRLAHAMMYGHLGQVMGYLGEAANTDPAHLNAAVEETWDELIAQAPSATCRRRVLDLRRQADTVGAVLWRRVTRAGQTDFQVPRRQRKTR
jgi:hypothetical protein